MARKQRSGETQWVCGRARLRALALLVVACSGLAGCPPPPLPNAEELLAKLSFTTLLPEVSCEELRNDFGVDNLPLSDNPGDVGIAYEEHFVDTPWGLAIRVWYMPAANSRGLVVASGGNTGSMACYLFTAQLLTESGWSVVMYDYQGFGGSAGDPWLGALWPDLNAVVDWARSRAGVEQVSLFGVSLGSIPTVAVAVDRPETVNAVILDSPIAMGAEIERFGDFISWAPEDLIRLLDSSLVSEAIIGELKPPLLVFLHGQDIVTPPEAVEMLFQLAGGPKTLVRFDDLEHAHGQFQRTEEYQHAMDQLLNGVWSK